MVVAEVSVLAPVAARVGLAAAADPGDEVTQAAVRLRERVRMSRKWQR